MLDAKVVTCKDLATWRDNELAEEQVRYLEDMNRLQIRHLKDMYRIKMTCLDAQTTIKLALADTDKEKQDTVRGYSIEMNSLSMELNTELKKIDTNQN